MKFSLSRQRLHDPIGATRSFDSNIWGTFDGDQWQECRLSQHDSQDTKTMWGVS